MNRWHLLWTALSIERGLWMGSCKALCAQVSQMVEYTDSRQFVGSNHRLISSFLVMHSAQENDAPRAESGDEPPRNGV
jgi:hypothetical protein